MKDKRQLVSYIELLEKIKSKEIKYNQKIWMSYSGRLCTYTENGDLIDDFTYNDIHEEHCLESLLDDNCKFDINYDEQNYAKLD
jgi:hypothetical protein